MADSTIDSNKSKFVKNYNEKVKKQRDIFSRIDSTMVILEKLPSFIDNTLDFSNANSFTYSDSPLGFIFNILHTLGVSEETLKEWIVDILISVLPTVEVGLKASLLSNIKSLISCNADPRIPLRFRKKVTDNVYTNILNKNYGYRGIDINIDAIDPQGILDLSPFTSPGMMYYFGCTDKTVHDPTIEKTVSKYDDGIQLEETVVTGDSNARTAKLARAYDFNAFVWYVIHKGNRQNPQQASIRTSGGFKTLEIGDGITYYIKSPNHSLMGFIEVIVSQAGEIQESKIRAGDTFYDINNPTNIAICIKSNTNENGQVIGNIIVPLSSDWFSCNWYVDKSNYYTSNLGVRDNKPRNYSEDKAICNLRYCQQYDYEGNILPDSPHNIRFTILPKPYVLLLPRPIKLMFDADGNPNPNGRFSLISEAYVGNIPQPTLVDKRTQGEYVLYDVRGINDGVLTVCTTLTINPKTGKYSIDKTNPNYKKALVECYPGLTVYEFNYDYIMGMKLFDPKVICQKIFDNAANPEYNAFFNFTLNKTKNKNSKYPFLGGEEKINEIIRSILEEDEDEIIDCFYKFSNEQYDEMLRKTEEIRYRNLPYNQGYNDGISVDFTEVEKILETYKENGSVDEQKEVISSALTKACDIIGNKSNITQPSDNSTVRIDFLTNVLQQLVAAIVNAFLSPKVLMLLIVNDALMEEQVDEPFNTEALMRALKNVIKSLVREIRDLIIKKLVDYIIEYLTPLALQLQAKILSEQFAAYMAVIRLLLSYYNKGAETVSRLNSVLSSIANKIRDYHGEYGDITEIDLPSILDNVDYADIYPTDKKDKEPIINNC